MVAPVDISETRHGRSLARLAALAIARAEFLQERMFEAETTEEVVSLANATTKAERSARQNLALEHKLICDNARAVRDEERQAREFRPDREKTHKEAVIRRREDLRVRLESVAWDEVPDAEWHEDFQATLHDVLDEEADLATFLEEPLDAQFERLKRDLNIGQAVESEDDEEDAEPEADADDPAEDDEPHEPFIRIPGKYKPDSS